MNFARFVAGGRLVVAKTSDFKLSVWETAGGKLVGEIDGVKLGKDGLDFAAVPGRPLGPGRQ